MANLTTTADIKTAVLNHVGELTNGTSPYDSRALEYINRVYQEIVSGSSVFVPDLGEPWSWAKAQSPGTFVVRPPYETGTVSLTAGLASGSFSIASPISLTGQYLRVEGRSEVFRISSHVAAATAFTLDAPYTDASGTFAFKVHQLTYSLGGGGVKIQRLVEPMRVYRGQSYEGDSEGKVYGVGSDSLTREWPLGLLQRGTPTHFATIGEVDGVFSIRVNKSVNELTKFEYEYIPVPADLTASPDTTPIIPREDRVVLVYGATYLLMVDKEDTRADYYFRLAQQKLQAMVLNRRKEMAQTAKEFGALVPRQDQVRRYRRPRTTSGLEVL